MIVLQFLTFDKVYQKLIVLNEWGKFKKKKYRFVKLASQGPKFLKDLKNQAKLSFLC